MLSHSHPAQSVARKDGGSVISLLTICHITARKDSKIEWFLDSLTKQILETQFQTLIKVVSIDFHADFSKLPFGHSDHAGVIASNSKPTVWQGKHRLTSKDYFAPANARNTGLCFSEYGWVAFVDDLSVLLPGWLNAVREAMEGGYIALGAYKKVKELTVENGEVKHFNEFPAGIDSRWNMGRDDKAVHASANMLYGCSLAGPVEAFLKINGWDERCDAMGLGSEDQMAGFMLERQGYELRYDRRMLTYESEELHHVEPPMTRVIQKLPGREDASWEMLRMVRDTGCKEAPNYFPEGGIRKERERVLSGLPFTVTQIPQHDWYSKRPLSDL